MRLENHQLLTVPDSLPIDRLEDRQPKILFVLDNLNQAMVLGQQLPRVDDGKKTEPLKSPLQTRLLETLIFYTQACGADRVRVIATARNEREKTGDVLSEWDKLETERYADFWQRFDFFELPQPEDRAVVVMLVDTATAAEIAIEGNIEEIARTNDRTFRNPVENLERIKSQGEKLSTDTYQQTWQGNWALRYQLMKAEYGKAAVNLYDGVDVLRQARVVLTAERVLAAAKVISGERGWRQWWQARKMRTVLIALEKTQRLLEPRDGQIEAKGYSADLDSCFEALCQKLQSTFTTESSVSSLFGLAFTAYEKQNHSTALALINQCLQRQLTVELKPAVLGFKGVVLGNLGRQEEAIAAYDAALHIKPDYHEALNNKGVALSALGRKEEAIAAYDAALHIKPDKHEALNNKGNALSALGRNEEAIAAYDAALHIKPDYHKALYNKGVALSALGRNEEAIAVLDQAIAINPKDPGLWYNKACCAALSAQTEKSLTYLQKAIELSSTNKYIKLAKTDTDFDSIRSDQRFQALIAPSIQ
ncbi:MAG: tetratricopeptide repeat protein [Cyanobacteria bacterium J06648_10]